MPEQPPILLGSGRGLSNDVGQHKDVIVIIAATPAKLHWNYFVALERDMEQLSRYVEFCEANFLVYSVELAHLLFAAASEVDVVCKLICEQVSPGARRDSINDYKAVLLQALPELPYTEVFVPRYGLSYRPWLNWEGDRNPDWWRSYNAVKHERDAHFNQATLQNALNALGALLVLTFHYYSRKLAPEPGQVLKPKHTTRELLPESTLLRLQESSYYSQIVV